MQYIYDPNTYTKYSIFSYEGKSLLKNYVNLFQNGGSSTLTTIIDSHDNQLDIESQSLYDRWNNTKKEDRGAFIILLEKQYSVIIDKLDNSKFFESLNDLDRKLFPKITRRERRLKLKQDPFVISEGGKKLKEIIKRLKLIENIDKFIVRDVMKETKINEPEDRKLIFNPFIFNSENYTDAKNAITYPESFGEYPPKIANALYLYSDIWDVPINSYLYNNDMDTNDYFKNKTVQLNQDTLPYKNFEDTIIEKYKSYGIEKTEEDVYELVKYLAELLMEYGNRYGTSFNKQVTLYRGTRESNKEIQEYDRLLSVSINPLVPYYFGMEELHVMQILMPAGCKFLSLNISSHKPEEYELLLLPTKIKKCKPVEKIEITEKYKEAYPEKAKVIQEKINSGNVAATTINQLKINVLEPMENLIQKDADDERKLPTETIYKIIPEGSDDIDCTSQPETIDNPGAGAGAGEGAAAPQKDDMTVIDLENKSIFSDI